MKQTILLAFLIFLIHPVFYAQVSPRIDVGLLKEHIEKLDVLGSVLYLGAHPDDENNYLLSYLSNEDKYRTAYLALNRGEGGQNLLGDEQGDYLGLIRTQELLDARRIEGDEQFFTRSRDFGFSKTAKETFDFWGHERILADVVYIIRKFRPDVIICRFPEDRRAGHGNHWASAILGHEAFIAAADPAKFPDQLKYVTTWQAKRIVWNSGDFWASPVGTKNPNQIKLNMGVYNPLLGEGYGEMQAYSRSSHRSQAQGSPLKFGNQVTYFDPVDGVKADSTLFDDVNTTWSRVEGGDQVQPLIVQAIKEFDMNHPEKSVPVLLQARKMIQNIGSEYWKIQKTKELDQIILQCAGINLLAYSDVPYVVAGGKLDVHIRSMNRSNLSVTLDKVDLFGNNEELNLNLGNNLVDTRTYNLSIPENEPVSQPYWMRKTRVGEYYFIDDQTLVGRPTNPPALPAVFVLSINGEKIPVNQEVVYRYVNNAIGEFHDPMSIVPDVTVNITKEVFVFTNGNAQKVAVKVHSFKDNLDGVVHLDGGKNFIVKNNDQKVRIDQAGNEQLLYFDLAPKSFTNQSLSQEVSARITVNGKTYDRSLVVIAYPHIPTITVFPPAETKVTVVDLKTTAKNIGYIMGAGDKVPEALEQIGLQVNLLSDAGLTYNNFKKYDAIVVGVRAYNSRKQLGVVQSDLLKYVEDGGTLVIQYNVATGYSGIGFVTNKLGPYPFTLSRDRVTMENSPVKFLLPNDPVLNTPNKITMKDFDGWIQERGLYFVDSLDHHYREPLQMYDPDAPSRVYNNKDFKMNVPLDGSLIVCNYGKGKYVYTGLSFFRELPAGVPGAFRLFANLISK